MMNVENCLQFCCAWASTVSLTFRGWLSELRLVVRSHVYDRAQWKMLRVYTLQWSAQSGPLCVSVVHLVTSINPYDFRTFIVYYKCIIKLLTHSEFLTRPRLADDAYFYTYNSCALEGKCCAWD